MYSEIYTFLSQNRELFRFLYSILIAFICLIIVLKTDRLFRISSHQGIRYFRNAFFFYGIAFVFRYLLGNPIYFNEMRVVFEFFMIIGGFCLFYSLIWKKFEKFNETSSLFNPRIIILYVLAFIIAFLDYLWICYNFLFFSQIIIFFFATIISYNNYKKGGKQHKFLKLYFVIMLLNLIAWVLNYAFVLFLDWRLRWVANIYIINVVVFLIFLYGVVKLTKRGR